MTLLADVRQALLERISAVPGVGVVHDHEPYIRQDAKLKELYVADGSLCGWHLRRIASRTLSPSVGRHIDWHRWVLRGFMAFSGDGTSEKEFDGLIEAIRLDIAGDETLGGLIAGMTDPETFEYGLQLEDAQPVLFCGVLCHSAKLTLMTEIIR
ncbi:hypothetical protein ACFQPI_20845 [Insolitispirillum peregrinum]|uniref:hypothetical protein n=1 Tax=Insolitispirillum peregrinum TaxID=80876 RepID=UPI00361A67FB